MRRLWLRLRAFVHDVVQVHYVKPSDITYTNNGRTIHAICSCGGELHGDMDGDRWDVGGLGWRAMMNAEITCPGLRWRAAEARRRSLSLDGDNGLVLRRDRPTGTLPVAKVVVREE